VPGDHVARVLGQEPEARLAARLRRQRGLASRELADLLGDEGEEPRISGVGDAMSVPRKSRCRPRARRS
jgi:hypothetical protein